MTQCGICTEERDRPEMLIHLPLYVEGSEGIRVCIDCRMLITEYIRGLRRVVARATLKGVKIGRRKS